MSDQRVPIPGSELPSRAGERWMTEDASSQTVTASVLLRRNPGSSVSEQELLSGHYKPASREAAAAALEADPQDIAAVRAFAAQYELKVLEENREARRIKIEGTVEQMDKAFGVTLRWASDSNGHRYFTYSGSLSVPQSLAGVVTAVLGLDQRPVAKHHAQ